MQFTDKIPDKSEFFPLYISTGWNQNLMLSAEQLEQAVKNSFAVISAYENNQLIGFGRVVSDGIAYATIYDVIVSPNWQKQGIGSSIIRKLVAVCEHNDIRSIHLFAAKGAEKFYKNLGFVPRPFDSPGMVYEKV
ncbi:MAG: GNAT family N-acetyltransferase [Gammaproteobacteria bacterium]|nr:GNAT family N-acetyltransferase [Gammaproteobacteria bacterium]